MAVLDETLEEKDHSLNIPEGYFSGLEGVNHLPVNNSQNNDNNQSIYNSSQESYEYSVRAKKSSKTGFSLCILTSFILIIYLGAFLSSSGFETPCFSLLYQEREYTQCSTRESVFSNLFYSEFVANIELDLTEDSYEKIQLSVYTEGYLAYEIISPMNGICVEIQIYPNNITYSCSLNSSSIPLDNNPNVKQIDSQGDKDNYNNDNNNNNYNNNININTNNYIYHYFGEDGDDNGNNDENNNDNNNNNNGGNNGEKKLNIGEINNYDENCSITNLSNCSSTYEFSYPYYTIFIYKSNNSLENFDGYINDGKLDVSINFYINLKSTSLPADDYSNYVFIYFVIGIFILLMGVCCCVSLQCLAYYYHTKENSISFSPIEFESFLSNFHSNFFQSHNNFYLDEYAIQLAQLNPDNQNDDNDNDEDDENNDVSNNNNVVNNVDDNVNNNVNFEQVDN